jgi:glycerol kinase
VSVLAIDAGTTGVTALVVDETGAVVARGYEEFPQHFPQPGWVEHEPEQIWQATLSACRQACAATRPATAVGITNQRETACSGTARRWPRRGAPSSGRTAARP